MEGRKLEFGKYLKKSLDILLLRGVAAEEVSKDEAALKPGMLILAIGGLAVAIGAVLEGQVTVPAEAAFLIFIAPAMNVLMFSVFIAMFHAFARLLGGKATFKEYYRATSLGWIISWTQVVPALGAVLSLWSIPVNVLILKRVHRLSMLEAAAVMALMMSVAMGMLYLMGMLG